MEQIKVSITTEDFRNATGYMGNSCYLKTALIREDYTDVSVGGFAVNIGREVYDIPCQEETEEQQSSLFTDDNGVNYVLEDLAELAKLAREGNEVEPIHLTLTKVR